MSGDFRCPSPGCGMTFQSESNRDRHVTTRHPIDVNTPFWAGQAAPRARNLVPGSGTIRAYLRVSTAEQTNDNQRARVRDALAYKGWDTRPVEWYEDVMSGARADRPHLTRLKADLRPGDVVVIVRPDRLARSTKDFCETTEYIHAARADIFCTDSPVDTTNPMSLAFWQMMGVFAQLERSLLVQRVKDNVAVRRAEGKKLGRHKAGCGILFPCPDGIVHKEVRSGVDPDFLARAVAQRKKRAERDARYYAKRKTKTAGPGDAGAVT